MARFHIIFCMMVAWTTTFVHADTLEFDAVRFTKQITKSSNRGTSELEFLVTGPRIGSAAYQHRTFLKFRIGTANAASDESVYIKFDEQWLNRKYYQPGGGFTMVFGDDKATLQEKREVFLFNDDEKVVLVWITENIDNLIEHALLDPLFTKKPEAKKWFGLTKRNNSIVIRQQIENISGFKKLFNDYETYKRHTSAFLETQIQPTLAKLGYYKGQIDGIWGPATKKAIQEFEKQHGLFPDGILRDKKGLEILKYVELVSNDIDLGPRFASLAEEADRLPINISSASFDNDKNSKLTDIVLETSFFYKGVEDVVKINGEFDTIKKSYSPVQLCVVNHHIPGRQAVCIYHTFELAHRRELNNYLNAIDQEEIDRAFLKCALVKNRFSEMKQMVSNDEFIYTLFNENEYAYRSAAHKCMIEISTYVEQNDPNFNVALGANDRKIMNELTNAKTQLKNAQQLAAKRQTSIEDLRSELAQLQNEKSSEAATYKAKLEARNNKIASLETAIREARSVSARRLEMLSDLRDQIGTSENQTPRNLTAQTDELQELRTKVRNLETAVRNARDVSGRRLDMLNDLREKLASRKSGNNSDVLDQRVIELETALEASRSIANQRQKLIQSYQEQIRELELASKNSDQSSYRISELEREVEAVREISRQQKDTIERLASQVDDNQSDRSKLIEAQKKIDALSSEIRMNEAEREKLQTQLAENIDKSEELEQLSTRLVQLQKQNVLYSGQIIALEEDKATTKDILSSKLVEKDNDLISKEAELQTLLGENAQLKTMLQVEQKSVQELNKSNVGLKALLEQANNKLKTVERELAAANENLAQLPKEPEGFQLDESWAPYRQWITPSQLRFCGILHEYEISRKETEASGNQLLQNMAIRKRDQDISALLASSRVGEDGFRSWVSIVESVFATEALNPKTGLTELAAGVILKTPCGNTLGTGRVMDEEGGSTAEFKYLAFEGDLIFTQLASVRRGDPVLFDGTFARSEQRSGERYVTNSAGKREKIEAYSKPKDAPDMFVNISYLAKL